MRPKDRNRAKAIDRTLTAFHRKTLKLPGIQAPTRRTVFIEQMLESIHRAQYVSVARKRQLSPKRADPTSDLFDPILGAAVLQDAGNVDEACWLVFLSVHFGRHRRTGWALARNTLGQLGGHERWNWATTSAAPARFRVWLSRNEAALKATGCFGNHRKYQSLDARSPTGTAAAFESYVAWIDPTRGHAKYFDEARQRAANDPRRTFDDIYQSMEAVASFGRTARFDYLTMLSKLRLADIEPGSTYMTGATGPLSGARLLFSGSPLVPIRHRDLDANLIVLDSYLSVGMQVLEDALCNWQKSPDVFIPFRG